MAEKWKCPLLWKSHMKIFNKICGIVQSKCMDKFIMALHKECFITVDWKWYQNSPTLGGESLLHKMSAKCYIVYRIQKSLFITKCHIGFPIRQMSKNQDNFQWKVSSDDFKKVHLTIYVPIQITEDSLFSSCSLVMIFPSVEAKDNLLLTNLWAWPSTPCWCHACAPFWPPDLTSPYLTRWAYGPPWDWVPLLCGCWSWAECPLPAKSLHCPCFHSHPARFYLPPPEHRFCTPTPDQSLQITNSQ